MNFSSSIGRVLAFAAALSVSLASIAENLNPKPFVVPEIKEWKGTTGNFKPASSTRIVYTNPSLKAVAEALSQDWTTMNGDKLVTLEGKPQKGDISLSIKKDKKLGDEGYTMKIGDGIAITAPTEKGAYWATRSLLQMAEQSEDNSLPQGFMRDWPDYPVRGFLFDVARKYIPLEYIDDLVKIMSYYKMNTLQLHLNDNGFKKFYDDDWDNTYAAFRLECDTYPGLAARDGFYTKQDFKDLQDRAILDFVEIIPEIDVPAHVLAFSHYRPDLGSDKYGKDHLDLDNPDLYPFFDALFMEYIGGEDPVFRSPKVHIGTDEYSNKDQAVVEQFRSLVDHYVRFMQENDREPWAWSCLNHAVGETPVKGEGLVQLAWSKDFGRFDDIVAMGSKVVNIPDRYTYIVPAAGYYYDYLNDEMLYNDWTPALLNEGKIEEFNPNMLGGMFAEWNDQCGNGVTVKDIHHRVLPALQTMATKIWNVAPTFSYADYATNVANLSEAPGVNQNAIYGEPNSIVLEEAIVNPGSNRVIPEIGYGYIVSFDLEANEEALGTPLFSSDNATFWLSDPVEGKLAFSRDGYLNTFDFRPYPGEKVNVKITGDNKGTALYINGKLIEDMQPTKRYINNNVTAQANYLRTLVFPLAKAGNFNSKISNLKVERQ